MGDKRLPLPYTSAKSEHRAFFRQSGIRFAAEKMLEFIELRVFFPQNRCPLLRITEHSRSPRTGGCGAPPMEISR
jgi:hypothetical protein